MCRGDAPVLAHRYKRRKDKYAMEGNAAINILPPAPKGLNIMNHLAHIAARQHPSVAFVFYEESPL